MLEKSRHLNPINPKKTRKELTGQEYVKGILAGDRGILARAITLIESRHPNHRHLAEEIIEACLPFSGKSFRIGITGVPGVGKSSFIEAIGPKLTESNDRLAILAIDPSSEISKGSILGDKTRMETLSSNAKVFIRPSPASNALGGVNRNTRESIILCEAAGYNYIIIETVGVGQSEIAVHSMVDFFLLLLLPGAGDELQGIKRGIVEMADMITINKADGDKMNGAKRAQIAYKNALHLFPAKENNWEVPVTLCSAINGSGLDEIINTMKRFELFLKKNGAFEKKREMQNQYWLVESINESMLNDFYKHPEINKRIALFKTEVAEGRKSPFKAAEELLKIYKNK
jgi:LAO/AO transport system kinase